MNTNRRKSFQRAMFVTGGAAMGVAMSVLAIPAPAQPSVAAGGPIQLADATHGTKGSHPDRLKPAYFENMLKIMKPDLPWSRPIPQPPHRNMPVQPQKKVDTILDLMGTALAAIGNAIIPAAEAAVPVGSKVDLKVLVIATDGTEPAYSAITAHLDRLGVPYDTLKAALNPKFRSGAASDGCALAKILYVGATATSCTPTNYGATNHGAYYAIILTSNALSYGGYYSFEWDAWSALAAYEKQFGVREASLYTLPGGWVCSTWPMCAAETLGLTAATDASGHSSQSTDPRVDGGAFITNAMLTTTGSTVFPYLNATNPITIKYANTYFAKAVDPTTNATNALITIPNGPGLPIILAATYTYPAPDGRQVLALTMDQSSILLHSQALAYGILNWVTKGLYIGERRVALTAQPDDLLIANDTYDPSCPSIPDLITKKLLPENFPVPSGYSPTRKGCTPGALADDEAILPTTVGQAILKWYVEYGPAPSTMNYRLTGTDLQNVVNWQTNLQELPNAASVMLEFAFNGIGATAFPNDTLMPVVLTQRDEFNWVSHTLEHMTLRPNPPYPNPKAPGVFSAPIQATDIWNQWAQNDTIAEQTIKAANYYSDAVVMPSISGLDYYNAMYVLRPADLAVKYSVSDSSIPAHRGPKANTGWYNHTFDKKDNHLVIPRFPMALYYNVSTPAEWVAEYNYFYGTDGAITPKVWGGDQTYEQLLDRESDTWLSYLAKGDRNPVMFHQANLRAFTWSGGDFPSIGLTNGANHTLLADLINATLTKYNKVFKLAITSPPLQNIGVQLKRLTDLYLNGQGLTATYSQEGLITQSITLNYKTPAASGTSTIKRVTGCDSGWRPLPGPGWDMDTGKCSNLPLASPPPPQTKNSDNPNPKPSLVVPVTGVSFGTSKQTYGGQTTSYVTVPSNVPVIMPASTAW